jgi:hypothetical protein
VKRTVLLSLAVLCLYVLNPTALPAQGDGVLQGQVINGTAGSEIAEGIEVVLRSFEGRDEGEQRFATTDALGQFRFEGLETGEDWGYLVQVGYQEVLYSPGILSFEAGQSDLSTEVLVYEATTDAREVEAERAHIFVTLSDTGLSVTELYVFSNSTDRTYVGAEEIDGRRWTSRFILPQDSHDLTLDDGTLGSRFLLAPGGFVDTEPHWPGTTSVLYSYTLDCRAGDCSLARELTHPISTLNLLIPDTGSTVASAQLVFEGKREAQGNPYMNYVGRNLASGQELDLRVRLPGAASQSIPSQRSQGGGQTSTLPWIILGAVLAALALVYPFWRRRIEAAARRAK